MTEKMTLEEMYDFLNEYVGVEAIALDLAFGLNGYNEETAADILYWFTGYRNFEQFETEILDGDYYYGEDEEEEEEELDEE